MRRLLLILVVCFVALPTTLFAGEKQLDGSWKLAAVAVGDVRVDVPPEMDVVAQFDSAKHTWRLRAKVEGDTHEATGTWRMQGGKLVLAFKGQEAPPVDVTVKAGELQIEIPMPEGERYTIIAKRTAGSSAQPVPTPAPTAKPGKPGPPPPGKPPR